MSYLCERQVSGLEPETSRPLFALSCCMWFIKSHFLLFPGALPTELYLPIRSVGLEPTRHMTEVFETSLYTYSSMTACGIGLIRSVPVCVKNSGNNTNSHFISQVSTFYYTWDLLCVLFSSACPRQGCVRTRLSLFQDTEYRRMTSCRNRTGTMRNARQSILIPPDLTGRWL